VAREEERRTGHGDDSRSGELVITLTKEGVSVSVGVDVLTAQEIRVKLGAAIGVAQGELQ